MDENQERQEQQPEVVIEQPKKNTIPTRFGSLIILLVATITGAGVWWYVGSYTPPEVVDVSGAVEQLQERKTNVVLDDPKHKIICSEERVCFNAIDGVTKGEEYSVNDSSIFIAKPELVKTYDLPPECIGDDDYWIGRVYPKNNYFFSYKDKNYYLKSYYTLTCGKSGYDVNTVLEIETEGETKTIEDFIIGSVEDASIILSESGVHAFSYDYNRSSASTYPIIQIKSVDNKYVEKVTSHETFHYIDGDEFYHHVEPFFVLSSTEAFIELKTYFDSNSNEVEIVKHYIVEAKKKLPSDYKIKADGVYYKGELIEGADSETFECVGDRYAKDVNFVYFLGKIVKGSSPVNCTAENMEDCEGSIEVRNILSKFVKNGTFYISQCSSDDCTLVIGESYLIEDLGLIRSVSSQLILFSDLDEDGDEEAVVLIRKFRGRLNIPFLAIVEYQDGKAVNTDTIAIEGERATVDVRELETGILKIESCGWYDSCWRYNIGYSEGKLHVISKEEKERIPDL